MKPAPDAVPDDEELLALLTQVEAREAMLRGAAGVDADEEDAAPRLRDGEPCPYCGEPALGLELCEACGTEGCLPRDDWMPGDEDPCLTRCARCGNHVHLDCSAVDVTGNAVCCGPRFARDDDVDDA